MALETATYVADLNASNPSSSDGLAQGDDHIRLVKAVLKATFANFTSAALGATQAQIDAAISAVVTGLTASVVSKGTLALPGVGFLSDPNTGLYSAGADEVDLSAGGVKVFGSTATATSIPKATTFGETITVTGAINGGTGQLPPLGSTVIWWTDTAPQGWLFANGQAVSRSTYAALFSLFGTSFGAGDSSTTFNVPDLRDVVPMGKGTMGGTSARGLITHLTTTTLGAVIGAGTVTLDTTMIPSHTHTNTLSDPGHTHSHTTANVSNAGSYAGVQFDGPGGGNFYTAAMSSVTTGITITNASQGGGAAHTNVQPSGICNFIIRAV